MSIEQQRHAVSTFELSSHVRQRLKYENDRRCIDKQVISDAVLQGKRGPNPEGDTDTAITYTEAGVTFLIVVNTYTKVVVTAYPIEFDRMEAIKSNRWTQTKIRSVQKRVKEGKTELI